MSHDDRAPALTELMLETLTLFEAILLYFCFILPAMIQAAASQNDIQMQHSYVVFSVAAPAGGQAPFIVGKDIGIWLRQEGEPEVADNFAGAVDAGSWRVAWPGQNYALIQTDGELKLRVGGWFRYDPQRMGDPAYIAATQQPITIYAYSNNEAADVQAALASGATPVVPLTIVLQPTNGLQTEVELPATLTEKQ